VAALKFAQANTVAVVITDINMPNIDGVTFIKELKIAALCQSPRLRSYHVVETGQTQDEDADTQGCMDYKTRTSWPGTENRWRVAV
jgi:Response regulator containing CheY-like receiver domain and AraC-type DNA-binding domain